MLPNSPLDCKVGSGFGPERDILSKMPVHGKKRQSIAKGKVMGRILRKVLTATAVIMVLYIGAQYWIGLQLEREVSRWTADLATQPGVQVRLLEYDRQLTRGTLRYDVTVDTDLAIDTNIPLLSENVSMWLALLEDEELTLEGSVAVAHGPWLSDQGFGIAEGTWLLEAEEGLRAIFPDTTARAPLATIKLLVGFNDRLRLSLAATDYDGRVIIPDTNEVARLRLAGLRGHVNFNQEFTDLTSEVELEELALSQVDAGELITVSASGVHVDGSWRRQEDGLWIGESESRTRQVSLSRPGALYRVSDAHQHTAMHNNDGIIQIDQQLLLGNVDTDFVSLERVEMSVSLGGIDAAAYLALTGTPPMPALLDEQAETQAIEALLRADPWLAINRVSVAMDNDDDILLTGRLQVSGARTLEEAPAATTATGELRIATNVIRTVAQSLIREDGAGNLSVAAQEEQLEDAYQLLMESLAMFWPVEITDDYVRGNLSMVDGSLAIGGQPLFDLFGTFLSQDPLDDVVLDANAEALYGEVSLLAGFDPDPQVTALTAGGRDWLNGLALGSRGICVGYVNAERPDLAVNYQGNGGALYVSVSSAWDTTLVIRTPDGDWHCNDDADGLGLNPGLAFDSALSGDYLIWVGTYEATLADAEISISELDWAPR